MEERFWRWHELFDLDEASEIHEKLTLASLEQSLGSLL